MRWDPLMIRWCLYLRHMSGRAYEMLRESGVIKLPSQRTLRDYTYYTQATMGFFDVVDRQLMEAGKIQLCPEREKYVVIIMDEMHIKEDVVYDKHTGTCIYTLLISGFLSDTIQPNVAHPCLNILQVLWLASHTVVTSIPIWLHLSRP